jgi:hypothetical protein
MKKLTLVLIALLATAASADVLPVAPNVPAATAAAAAPAPSTLSTQFDLALLQHVTAAEAYRSNGSHVVKFTDGIVGLWNYKGDYIITGTAGFIPHPEDPSKFFSSYGVHAHVMSLVAKYFVINPSYAPILQDLELTPGWTWDQDVPHRGLFEFCVGYSHKFGT